jgi:hypothetical protein
VSEAPFDFLATKNQHFSKQKFNKLLDFTRKYKLLRAVAAGAHAAIASELENATRVAR